MKHADPALPGDTEETPLSSTRRWGPLRDAAAILLNAVIAIAGPTLAEPGLFRALGLHPRTPLSLYLAAVLGRFVTALVLGFVIYRRWQPAAATWIWIGGFCGFAWHLANNHEFITQYALVYWFWLDVISAQAIGYSAGALLSQLIPLDFGALIAGSPRNASVEDEEQPDNGPQEEAASNGDGGHEAPVS